MTDQTGPERIQTVVVGGGQAGLSVAGRHPGHVPFRIEGAAGRVLVPLVRTKPKDVTEPGASRAR